MQSDDDKKAILYSNTAASCDTFQNNIDSWLDGNDTICGDTLLIKGMLESEWKFKAATMFTTKPLSTSDLVDKNRYYPRILIATASCIGAGLDCSEVYCVIRDGFPASMMHLSQELGRCGRERSIGKDGYSDNFELILNMESFVYLNERLYVTEKTQKPDKSNVSATSDENDTIKKVDYVNLRQQSLLDVASMIFTNKGCWHSYIENDSVINNIETNLHSECRNACPFCINKCSDFILPVNKEGTVKMLADIFIANCVGEMNCVDMVDKIKKYNNVGTLVYGRRTPVPPGTKFIQSTVIALISCDLLKLNITFEEQPKATCKLSVNDKSFPNMYDNSRWLTMYLL